MIFKMNKSRLSRKIAATLMMWMAFPIGAFAAESNETNEDATEYVNMEDMLITAERIPTNKWDTPANIAIITAKEIEDNHYQDLAEALNSVNGVVAYSGRGGLAILNGSFYVAVLIDGYRLKSGELESHGNERSVDLNHIPNMKMIERIEILKGGGSALYGSDAVGGVVNIITKKGKRHETLIDINTGSWGKRNLEIANQGKEGNFSWFITGSLQKSKPFTYANESIDEKRLYEDLNKQDYNDKSFSARFDNRFDDYSSISALVAYRKGNVDLGLNYVDVDRREIYKELGINNPMTLEDIYSNMIISYNFKERTTTPGFFRAFNSERSIFSDSLFETWSTDGEEIYIDFTRGYKDGYIRTRGIGYQNGWQLGNHKIITGCEWYREDVSQDEYVPDLSLSSEIYNGNHSINNTVVYLQDTIAMGNKWNIIPGVRLDHYSNFGNQWSPKIAVNYRADDKTKFYASWGRVFKAPSLTDLYFGPYQNPNLKPMKGNNISIGFEHDFDEKTNMSFNLFKTNLSDVIALANYYDDNHEYVYSSYYNASEEEKQHGFELTFRQKLSDKWSYNLGYSHTSADEYENWHCAQPNGYRVGINYRSDGWKVNLLSIMGSGFNNNFVSGFSDFSSFYAPSKFAVFNLNASYEINPQATIYAKINNITNQDYAYYGGPYNSPGRFFQIGATYKF